jgi:hypothetical protein
MLLASLLHVTGISTVAQFPIDYGGPIVPAAAIIPDVIVSLL